jgi:archaellum component FlaF (FlaF/FlaG flagellin family)
MSRSKKIFLFISLLVFVGLVYFSYDISTKTTFPGSKSQLKERLKKQYLEVDTLHKDSANTIQR